MKPSKNVMSIALTKTKTKTKTKTTVDLNGDAMKAMTKKKTKKMIEIFDHF